MRIRAIVSVTALSCVAAMQYLDIGKVTAQTTQPGYLRSYVVYPVPSSPEAVAIGDLNHDGLGDAALLTGFGSDSVNDFCLFVFLQDGAGELRAPMRYPVGGDRGMLVSSVDVGDVNGDARDDVVVGRGRQGISVLLQNAEGKLDPGVVYPTTSAYKIRIRDFNSDGRLDVAGVGAGTSNSSRIEVFAQQANGRLASVATYPGVASAWTDLDAGDLNGDSREDLVILNTSSIADLSLLLQQPGGLFDVVRARDGVLDPVRSPDAVGVGDLNGDGRDDVAATSYYKLWIGLQNAAGKLGAMTSMESLGGTGFSVEVADVDSDQRADVVVEHGGRLGVFRQKADGTLGGEEMFGNALGGHWNTHSLAVGDVSGDGATDVVVANHLLGLIVYLQNPPQSGPGGRRE